MKKVIALALALVLALSLGVSALAITVIKPTELSKPSSGDDGYILIDDDFGWLTDVGNQTVKYVADPEGGVFYVAIVALPSDNASQRPVADDAKEYKNVVVEKDGNVTAAELVAYDPAKYTTDDYKNSDDEYTQWAGIDGEYYYAECSYKAADGTTVKKYLSAAVDEDWNVTAIAEEEVKADATFSQSWAVIDAIVDAYNKQQTTEGTLGGPATTSKHNYSIKTDANIYLLKITVAENYGVAFTEGYFKIKADLVESSRKTTAVESAKVKVISDVAVFDYDTVIWATKNGEDLNFRTDDAYSDYRTYLATYMPNYKGQIDNVYMDDYAAVISTTEFRAINDMGKGVTVAYPAGTVATNVGLVGGRVTVGNVRVVIGAVAATQKGVNFWLSYKENRSTAKTWGKLTSIDLDFKGKDVIASDATVEIDLPYTNVELLNDFGKKVEEEDIVTYYILKDGKLAGQFTVDYLKDNWNDQVKFDIAVKAGEALGKYTVALAVPAAGTEENPNTGAESVIGVVAAMAAVSVVAAAAVSLKK